MSTTVSIFSAPLLLLLAIFYSSTTTSAQLSPVKAPAAAPPVVSTSPPPATLPAPPTSLPATSPAAAAPAPGLSTVPLVPNTPSAAPGPAVAVVPKTLSIDIVQILRKAKRFTVLIRLLKTTQLINQLNSQLATSGSGGLTIFAPEDAAFSKLKAGFLNSLNDRQKVELLQFHTISTYISISNFDTLTNPVQTQAGDDPKRLQLNVTMYGGNQVSMTTGAVNASLTGTVYTDNKLAIYQVDKVLLPLDIVLPKASAPAPGPAAAKGDSPKTDKTKAAGGDQSGGDDDGDSNGKAVPANSSMGLKVEVMWVRLAVGVAFVAGAMIM
ncbi:fasciclin-like arabinogalactan protein 11 [Prosopis cineraria]|uniref:fasciclin-like arabinogalactan protein 11 n=1 Tax=Prosopis cineraria TaxID=364024 RepID=UPI002410310B|nr:fasciclin-like arabinogalactan protein 11 [Prosopis cineraria]